MIPNRQGILYSDAWTDEDIRRANDTGQSEQERAYRKPEAEEADDEQEGKSPGIKVTEAMDHLGGNSQHRARRRAKAGKAKANL